MAGMGGYRSPVDLGLPRVPSIQDAEAYEELTPVYNAIHLLNAYLDKLRNEATGGGSGQTPAESMIFNRFFVAKALVPIPIGSPVAPQPNLDGMIPGCSVNSNGSVATFCGIALTEGVPGEEFRVGVGPAALELPGIPGGAVCYAYAALATNGLPFRDSGLYVGNPGAKSNMYGTAYPVPVAVAVTPGFVVFGQTIVQ